MSDVKRVAVMGASGFVGSATCSALEASGMGVIRIRAPRLPGMSVDAADDYIKSRPQLMQDLIGSFRGVDAVVNAAGNPDASSRDVAALVSANGVLPGLAAAAAREAQVPRFVHISSAVVQGRRPQLDDTDEFDAFSAYARSKVLGETLANRFGRGMTVVYRPPSVHGPDRRVTRLTAQLAASPLSSVARPRTAPTPQAHITNVAAAVAFLTATALTPPATVIHPWEQLTTSDTLEVLGGRRPVELPRSLSRAVVRGLELLGHAFPPIAANARRLEMLWFGQPQARSWLTTAGWTPPAGRAVWEDLGVTIRNQQATEATRRSKDG